MGWGGTITSLQLRSLLDIRAVTLNMASSSDAVGWGGVGQRPCSCAPSLTHLRPHSKRHRLQMQWGGVGWGGTITSLQLRSLLDIRAVTINMASSSDAVGWGGVGQ